MTKNAGAVAVAATTADDSDLEDLLSHKEGDHHLEHAPLNLDHLTKGQLDVPSSSSRHKRSLSITAYASAWISYMCYAHPKCCSALLVVLITLGMIVLVNVVVNPTKTFGVIPYDYSNIQSEYDLSIGKIDHWCLKGDNDSCRCEHPLEPTSRGEYKSWIQAHHANKNQVDAYKGSSYLDVAFVGESLIEEMNGRWMGRPQTDELLAISKSFDKYFDRKIGGMDGIALGIAGDTSPNVLWRLLHGEMPPDLEPRVWWLSLGMNDLGRMQCSEEVVVMGILRVVEEILTRKPGAKIVINSMLPMADLRGGVYPLLTDYRDAFRQYKGRPVLVNPTLIARNPRATISNVSDTAKQNDFLVPYKRPETTTTALDHRASITSKGLNKVPPGLNKKGTPPAAAKKSPPPAAAKTTPPISSSTAEKPKKEKSSGRVLKKKVKETIKDKEKGKDKETVKDKENRKETKAKRKKVDSDETPDGDTTTEKNAESKEESKLEKKYLKKVKKDPVNPKIDFGKTKVKARDPTKVFVKPSRLPLWTSIHAINNELIKFADKHDEVTFFDATNIFAEKEEGSKYVLMSDRISIRGHPTELGFELWHAAMYAKLTKMLEKDDVDLKQELDAKAKKDKEGGDKSPAGDVKQTNQSKGGAQENGYSGGDRV